MLNWPKLSPSVLLSQDDYQRLGLRIQECVPREGVLLSLGVRVYVSRNPTWMGLCAHACMHCCVW